jgi:hypothetical protein
MHEVMQKEKRPRSADAMLCALNFSNLPYPIAVSLFRLQYLRPVEKVEWPWKSQNVFSIHFPYRLIPPKAMHP